MLKPGRATPTLLHSPGKPLGQEPRRAHRDSGLESHRHRVHLRCSRDLWTAHQAAAPSAGEAVQDDGHCGFGSRQAWFPAMPRWQSPAHRRCRAQVSICTPGKGLSLSGSTRAAAGTVFQTGNKGQKVMAEGLPCQLEAGPSPDSAGGAASIRPLGNMIPSRCWPGTGGG